MDAVWQMRADHRDRHDLALTDILRTRDDLDEVGLAHIHLADPEVVGVRMALDFLDAARHDALEARVRADDVFHRHAGHREAVGQLFRRPIEINIIFQPLNGNLHVVCSPSQNQNWRRKRMSLS